MSGMKPITKQHSTRYMPGLDGLRAVAVLAVLVYHLSAQTLTGGFLGVDTFFVISGFLITSLLLNEYEQKGRIDFKGFWVRRFRRLIPAVVFLLLVVTAYTLFFHMELLESLKSDVIAALVYLSNWWFIYEDVSYFEALEPNPLTHLWSLAIEEQFYIVWPVLLLIMLVVLRKMKRLFFATFILALASLIIMIVLSEPLADNSRVYFGTDTRAHSLLVGVMLAYIFPPFKLKQQVDKVSSAILNIVGVVSLALLIMFFYVVSSEQYVLYIGGLFGIAIVTAFLVAASVHPSTFFATKLLGNPLMVWIGRRSYSLYLWHYPVIVFSSMHFVQGQIPIAIIALQTVLSFVLAEISFKWIEGPFRKEGFRFFSFRTVGRGVRTSLIAMLTLLMGLVLWGGLDEYVDEVIAEREAERLTGELEFAGVQKTFDQSFVNQRSIRSLDPLVIGDSLTVDIQYEILNRMPNATVDGVIGRQMWDLEPLIREQYPTYVEADDIVILQLGTNGAFHEESLLEVIDLFGDATIYLINTRSPREWQDDVNQMLNKVAGELENVHLIDWFALSAGRTDFFEQDGIHLVPTGRRALVQEIVDMIDAHSLQDLQEE